MRRVEQLRGAGGGLLLLVSLMVFGLSGSAVAGVPSLEQEQEEDSGEKEKTAPEGLPLEPTRRLSIHSNEGSWLSLDVSPDGATIVFDFLGDLYLLPIEGGPARQLTKGMAFDAQPRFSPDGQQVVFTSDRNGGENLWLLNVESEEALPLTKGKNHRYQSPEWTPDGGYVIASRTGIRSGFLKLWMFHRDGGTGLQLIKEPEELKTTGAAFGKDGRYVWHAQRTRDWRYNAILPEYQLAVYDRETGQTYVRSQRQGSAFRPTLSPDGRWLVYGTRHEDQTGLRLRELSSGEERWLAYPVQHDDQESRGSRDVLPGMSFTPDSQHLVTSYGGRIWKVPVDGSQPREIAFEIHTEIELGPELDFDYPISDSEEFVIRQIRDAAPSPDGSRLAFTALNRLYVMEFPDGVPRLLTQISSVQAQPSWSPDGRDIVFVTWDRDEGHVVKIAASGGEPQVLTSRPGIYQQPVWSPDGSRIVVIRGPARIFREDTGSVPATALHDLTWIPASGGEPVLIAPTDRRIQPHFRQDQPDRIYLFHGEKGLLSIRWDGTDQKEHLKVVGNQLPGSKEPAKADLIVVSPQGGKALAQVDQDLYVVTVPQVGGETPQVSVADPEKAPVPVRRLTEIGGQFPAWGKNGRVVHWSIGNAHVVYDLDQAQAAATNPEPESADEGPDAGYQPLEKRVEITARRDLPQATILLNGARLITMRGTEVMDRGDILVVNNRIQAIGPSGSLSVPSEAQRIDVTGKTIVPGFVDVHAHLRPSRGVHKQHLWSYLANLAYGVTTTRDPQTGTTDVLTYADLVRSGQLLGPRIYSTGPGVFWSEQIKNLDHARRVLKRYSEYYDTQTIKMYVAGNRQQRQWIIQAAREQRLMPTTEGSLDLKLNLTQIIDGYPGHEHSFPVYPLYSDVVQLCVESGVTYTPTLLVAYGGPWAENYFYVTEDVHDDRKLRHFTPHSEIDRKTRRRGQGTGPGPGGWFLYDEHVFPKLAEFVRDLVEAGGRAGVGSHGQLQGLGYHWELWAMQSGGLSRHDALRVATIQGAEAIGLDQDLGSLEVGKLADLVVLDRNPLEDIRNSNTVRYVMLNGRLYEGDTLEEIAPRARPLAGGEWVDDEPDTAAGLPRK